jgi:DNA-binding transcriptional LysR family regulator
MSGMRDATLRQLQIFASAARTLSFSRTARELYLTQPAVSMQVRQLEDRAGLPLFERMKRRLYLTEAGQEMARHATQVLRSLQDADEAFAAMRGLKGGRIAVVVTSTAKYFAPKLVARFARAHPEVEMRLLVNNREAVVRLLAGNEVDLALMGTPPKEVETVAAPFAPHPFVVVAPPEHRLAGRRVALADLAGETFLVREPGSGTRAAMGRFFQEHHVAIRVGMEMSSNETIKQAVMAGMGLSFISQHTVSLELATGQLALVSADGLPVMRRWYVVQRREKRLSPAAEAFREFVLAEGGEFLRTWPLSLRPPRMPGERGPGPAGGRGRGGEGRRRRTGSDR